MRLLLVLSRDEAASDSDDSDCVITSYTQAGGEG